MKKRTYLLSDSLVALALIMTAFVFFSFCSVPDSDADAVGNTTSNSVEGPDTQTGPKEETSGVQSDEGHLGAVKFGGRFFR